MNNNLLYNLKEMSHLEQVIVWTGAIVKATFTTNILPKVIATFFATIYWLIVHWNETIIWMIILIYFIDFFTWTLCALKLRSFESRRFFLWCTKLLVYWVFMVIGVSMWEVLNLWNFFLSWVFAFILITDSSSTIENLDRLWYNTPLFLKKYLKTAQANLNDKYNKQWE